MGFVIERNALTSVTCGGTTVALSPPVTVRDGAFSSSEDDGLLMTGSIVSDVSAMGRIDTAA
jgi:hypothetical protein